MIKRHALMESISSNLNDFLKQTGKNLSVPEKKFLQDSLIGLLRAGQPIVSQMARQLPNQQTKFLSRLDRLEQHLGKDSNFDNEVEDALPEVWLPFVQNDTPIIVDLSDLAKPLAKVMDYLATVRDGSTGKLVNGYWVVEIYASLTCKNPVPIKRQDLESNNLDAFALIFLLTFYGFYVHWRMFKMYITHCAQ